MVIFNRHEQDALFFLTYSQSIMHSSNYHVSNRSHFTTRWLFSTKCRCDWFGSREVFSLPMRWGANRFWKIGELILGRAFEQGDHGIIIKFQILVRQSANRLGTEWALELAVVMTDWLTRVLCYCWSFRFIPWAWNILFQYSTFGG